MSQVNQNSQLQQLSLEERLAREKQLANQLGPLKMQLETVRKTGPVNGISEDALVGLIEKHEEFIGDLRESIDKDIKPEQTRAIPGLESKVDDYLARHGKVHTTPEAAQRPHIESMPPKLARQVMLINQHGSKPTITRENPYHKKYEDYKQDVHRCQAEIFYTIDGLKKACNNA